MKESNKNFRNAVPLKGILKTDATKMNFNVSAQAISKYILNSRVSKVNLAFDLVNNSEKLSGNNNLKYSKNKKEFRHGIMNRRCS